jgi:hypothetical protein
MHTRIKHTLALFGLFALVAFLIPSHAEGGTIPTPSGTGAVCVVIRGRVVSGGAGSITLNAASGTATQTTTIFAGSYCNFRRAYAK